MKSFEIPQGFALVPEAWIEKYFSKAFWTDIEIPDINEAASFANVGIEKIKKDLNKVGCPLEQINEGARGRGNIKTFTKNSVEAYKHWLKNRNY